MNIYAHIVLKFRDVRQPFPVWRFRRKFPVQHILRNELGIGSLPCAPMVGILDRGLDPLLTAYPKYPFVIDFDIMVRKRQPLRSPKK